MANDCPWNYLHVLDLRLHWGKIQDRYTQEDLILFFFTVKYQFNIFTLPMIKLKNYTLPMIAASTKRLSRLHTIILTPRGVGRNLCRGPPRGGCGGNGGGGTFRWYARVQRPTFPYNDDIERESNSTCYIFL